MAKGQALRRGEHRPCVALQETVCEMTRKISDLNSEEDRLEDDMAQFQSDLRLLGWSIQQLDALSRIPDTGAALEEIERNRRRNALLRNFNRAFRHGRTPRLAVDVTIEGIRTAARIEVEKLRVEEREIADRFHRASRQLRDIRGERRDAERILAEAGRRADKERCDPNFVQRFCG
ncbi:MAG: hypothetical protein NXI12_07645 [Alphaproteobacteria bacterium]|nr:hypothetical protein [Alphaproteobacteria bacterium]